MPQDEPDTDAKHLRIRQAYSALSVQFALARLRGKAGFNPNQPRVPAGHPNGGEWTRVVGPSAGRATQSSSSRVVHSTRTHRDRTGEQPWSSYAERMNQGGRIVSRAVQMRDGAKIDIEYQSPGVERSIVTLGDGSRFTFENEGERQTILDDQSRVLSSTVWAPQGAAAVPTLLPASKKKAFGEDDWCGDRVVQLVDEHEQSRRQGRA